MKQILYITMALLVLVSCKKTPPISENNALDQFKNSATTGAYVDGKAVLSLNEATHQVSVNPTKLTYRIQTDIQNIYLHTELTKKPSAIDEEVDLKLQVKGISALSDKTYKVKLIKVESGRLWLWEDASKTGFIIPQ